MQVDPNKPTLKPPGTKRLKLEYDEQLPNFGFKFNLRRYTVVAFSVLDAGRVSAAAFHTIPRARSAIPAFFTPCILFSL